MSPNRSERQAKAPRVDTWLENVPGAVVPMNRERRRSFSPDSSDDMSISSDAVSDAIINRTQGGPDFLSQGEEGEFSSNKSAPDGPF